MPPPAFGVVGIDSWAGESFFGTLDLVFRASKSVVCKLYFFGASGRAQTKPTQTLHPYGAALTS